jgi:hypothetical protein
MTIKEIKEILNVYADDMPVVALWDGGWSNLEFPSVETDDEGNKVLEFDVTEYGTYG